MVSSFSRTNLWAQSALSHTAQLSARFDGQSGQGVTSVYDGFGRLASSSINLGGIARALTHQYDNDGNRTRITHPDASYFKLTYDALDRLRLVQEPDNDQIAVLAYDPPGRPASLTFLGGSGTSYTYDGVSRLASLAHALDGASHDSTWTYGYNPASQIRTVTRTNDAYAFGHANAAQALVPDGLNRYASVGGVAHAYDANGNLADDGPTNYVYDIENRLVSASGARNGAIVYDPLGRIFQSGGPAGDGELSVRSRRPQDAADLPRRREREATGY